MGGDLQTLGRGFYWQELSAGQRFKTYRRTVTEADLVGFINCTGMLEALFIDKDYSEMFGAIAGRVVPGALTFGLIEGLLFQSMIQGTGLAMLEVHLKAVAPVLVGDTIYGVVEVTDVQATSKANRGTVSSTIEIRNQRDEIVMNYNVTRLLAGRP